MKTFVVIFLGLIAITAAKYTDEYDNIDVDEIMDNCRLLVPYIKCALGEKSKCTREGQQLADHIGDALTNHCAECTEHQKTYSKRVIGFLINKQKVAWEKLKQKYDPNNEYVKKYEKELQELATAGTYDQFKECEFDFE